MSGPPRRLRRLPLLAASAGIPQAAATMERARADAARAVSAALAGPLGLPPGRDEAVAAAASTAAVAARGSAEFFAKIAKHPGGPKTPACREGCAHCCHQPIAVTFAEILRALDALGDGAAAAGERARAAAWRLRGLPFDAAWEAREPCPLLDGGRCLAYAARPVACASYYSADAGACAGAAEAEVPRFAGPLIAAAGVLHALGAGLAAAGLDGRQVWLAPALAAVVADPSLVGRWLAGARLPSHLVDEGPVRQVVAPPRRPGA